MATVNFLYRSTKDKAFLHLRLLHRDNNIDYVIGSNTKLEVTKVYWSKHHTSKRQRDIEIANKQIEVKSELNKIENHVLKNFHKTESSSIDKKWLQNTIEDYYNPPQLTDGLPKELLAYIDVYIDFKRLELADSTITKFNGVKGLISRFQVEKNKVVLISEVNLKFKKEFEDYCFEKKYAPNTVARAIRFIKTFCRHAYSNGLEVSYQLGNIKSKNVKTEKVYLTREELEEIENTDYNEHLDNAKDWLIISCYTGQRVSDFMRFTKDMIRYEMNKTDGKMKPLIEFTQKKTSKIMTVPLHNKVIEILEKRNGNFPSSVSDQKYNKHIKIVCRDAKINSLTKGSKNLETEEGSKIYRKVPGTYPKWELVTSHIGRRSFASNFYGEIPTTYLTYITGHSTEVMFLNYIGKSNKDKAMEMTNFF
ncbi:phage integrase family protein [Dokdonia sp. Hel_I_63]|uniref:tyrosine-type recombinase/integrase n=1 Tax=Dokdonia sp. Hel_I_63 TaxID=1249996 RepID=UPI00119B24A5|nr:phage integrase SAM-like domain-containing protein [Dokdonia sp. Hel_I_63]TVZ23452.1 phage integrase family protein [Dokdonia sp. Hel_I_63]